MTTIRLFDLENGAIVASEHCYILKPLKDIMDNYEDHLKIYQYIFYMTCPNPDLNPFFNVDDLHKEQMIIESIDADFSLDDDMIIDAVQFCKKLYETPTYRAYMGIKTMLDRLGDYMSTTTITHGRDGNINSLVAAASKFQQIRDSYKGAYQDLLAEQSSVARGGANLAYDDV